jgi:hypothetical protein
MKQSTFTNEQILYALRQVEAGTPVAEVCRKLKPPAADLTLDRPLREEVIRTKLSSRPSAVTVCRACRSASRCVNGGHVTSSPCIAPPLSIAVSHGIRPRCGCGCGNSPPAAYAMVTVGSTCSCNGRDSRSITSWGIVGTNSKGSRGVSNPRISG